MLGKKYISLIQHECFRYLEISNTAKITSNLQYSKLDALKVREYYRCLRFYREIKILLSDLIFNFLIFILPIRHKNIRLKNGNSKICNANHCWTWAWESKELRILKWPIRSFITVNSNAYNTFDASRNYEIPLNTF